MKNKLKKLQNLRESYKFLLCTDMYQLKMNMVYMGENRHNEEVVFECFVRNIREKVSPKKDIYYFSGEKEIHTMMKKIENIFNNETIKNDLKNDLKKIILFKINNEKKKEMETIIDKAFETKPKIEYKVLKENTPVYPLIPVFIFKGARWIGQLIETMVTNIINGKTGYNTLKKLNLLDEETDFYLKNLTLSIFDEELPDEKVIIDYKKHLDKRAKEYKSELNKNQEILDASYRRAPGFYAAYISAETALENDWNSTSNTTLYFIDGERALKKIGGSFAHSFVMGHNSEKEAYKKWLKYYPNTVLLIDTYAVLNAVKIIIENNMNVSFVRIDSEPLDIYALEVYNKFKEAGFDTKNYLSSDITPEILKDYNKRDIPFNRLMAGTKYVNCGSAEKINCGFVYKITVNSINGEVNFPEKKATGKVNYAGYKQVIFQKDKTVMKCIKKIDSDYGYKYEVDVEDISKKYEI